MYEKFMSDAMKKKDEKIQREKNKVEAKEKNHKKRLRQLRTTALCNWGGSLESVFREFDMGLDNNEIAGMALEALNELKKQPALREAWAKKGSEFFSRKNKNRKQEGSTLIISFTEKPHAKILSKIKEHHFKYSSPFKSWYKKNPDEETKTKIEEALKETNAKIEMIGNFTN